MEQDFTHALSQLYLSIFADIDKVCPELHFKRVGSRLMSAHHPNDNQRDRGGNQSQTVYFPDHGQLYDVSRGSMWIVDYYAKEHGGMMRGEAIRALFQMYGIDEPSSGEVFTRLNGWQRLREQIKSDTNGAAGGQVREYLTDNASGRGWSKAVMQKAIDNGHIGVLTADTLKELERLTNCPNMFKVGDLSKWLAYITLNDWGEIVYIKLRYAGTPPEGLSKSKNPSGLQRTLYTQFLQPNAGCCYLVEGEADALHPHLLGFQNVIATRGGNVSNDMAGQIIDTLRRYRVSRLCIIPDNDETPKALAKGIPVIERAARRAGILLSVGYVPNGCKDLDELCTRHGKAALLAISQGRKPVTEWQTNELATQFNAVKEDYDKREAVANVFIDYVATLTETQQAAAVAQFNEATDGAAGIDVGTIAERRTEIDRKQRIIKAVEGLRTAAEKGEQGGILAAWEAYTAATTADSGERYIFNSIADLCGYYYQDTARDLDTGIVLYNTEGERERLTLPAAAITVISAGTGGGKTTMLQNIAFRVMQEGRKVLYYSLEEEGSFTTYEFCNIAIFSNIENRKTTLLKQKCKNVMAIRQAFGTLKNGAALPTTAGQVFDNLKPDEQQAASVALADFLQSAINQLYIFDAPRTAAEVERHALTKCKELNADAIFIDYAQLMRDESSKATTADEMQTVMKALIRLAKASKIPVVLAAQMIEKNNDNAKESKDPFTLGCNDIFGASAIAQGANQVLLVASSSKYLKDTPADCKADNINTFPNFGSGHYLALKIDKTRHGSPKQYGIFDWQGGRRVVGKENLLTTTTTTATATASVYDDAPNENTLNF